MGDPRRLRKKYATPNNPFEKERIVEEFSYLGKYGLRNKKEFRRHKYQLSKMRQLARSNKTLPQEIREDRFAELRDSLVKIGLVNPDAHSDDILSLSVENILERRLQTIVFKNGLAKTITQARQLTTHGHIAVNNNVIDSPSYLVKKEDKVTYSINSPFHEDQSKIWGLGKSAPKEEVVEE
ncbi:30S ribosomal protein S4 [Candidatus Lokiarchaeum ossiferum]|uniref:30S ribosomal protein S4 n=1 Tax=Candidatus Lokiarchaeum ossiferum TaxID=2951803 RepID=A0ABY6HXL4_9ARCH|nr:30S ribosomal protein S4 [Candidatus Lokiarchaeum sp. B-35]